MVQFMGIVSDNQVDVWEVECYHESTRSEVWPHGNPAALFGSLMISWACGSIISVIVFLVGKWKKKMMNQ